MVYKEEVACNIKDLNKTPKQPYFLWNESVADEVFQAVLRKYPGAVMVKQEIGQIIMVTKEAKKKGLAFLEQKREERLLSALAYQKAIEELREKMNG